MTISPSPFSCSNPKLLKLINRLQFDYPDFEFNVGKRFAWRAPRSIMIGLEDEANAELLLLHELGHGVLGHKDYGTDVERLRMEVEAWEKARELAKVYGVSFDEEVAEAELDTYRDWLHKKSRCPACGLTRFQDKDGYHCPRCEEFKK